MGSIDYYVYNAGGEEAAPSCFFQTMLQHSNQRRATFSSSTLPCLNCSREQWRNGSAEEEGGGEWGAKENRERVASFVIQLQHADTEEQNRGIAWEEKEQNRGIARKVLDFHLHSLPLCFYQHYTVQVNFNSLEQCSNTREFSTPVFLCPAGSLA